MLIRSFHEIEAAGRVIPISHGNSTAVRVLLKADNLGFSLSEARCGAGNKSKLWYKNHWEANYVRAGTGSLINRRTGKTWKLNPGTLYCVGPQDQHSVENSSDPLRIVSIFNPAIEGMETHDKDGAYPPTGEIPPGQNEMFVKTISDLRSTGNKTVLAGGKMTSIRMLTASDDLGFSLSDVSMKSGSELNFWYKYHWQANLVLRGTLHVTDTSSDTRYSLSVGDVYCVGPQDQHLLQAETDIHLLSIFNPPLAGSETHDDQGSYPPSGPAPKGPD